MALSKGPAITLEVGPTLSKTLRTFTALAVLWLLGDKIIDKKYPDLPKASESPLTILKDALEQESNLNRLRPGQVWTSDAELEAIKLQDQRIALLIEAIRVLGEYENN